MKINKLRNTLTCLIGATPIIYLCASCSPQINPVSITINVPEQIYQDDFYTFTANVEPSKANQEVIWSLDNPEMGTINPQTGDFSAKKYGEVIIFATSVVNPHVMQYQKIEVKAAPKKISIIGDNTIAINCPQKYSAVVEPAEASQVYTWKLLSSEDIATISDDGILLVNPQATVGKNIVLIATSENEKISYAQIKITIKSKPESVQIIDYPETIGIGEKYQCQANCLPESSKQDVVWTVDDQEYATIENGKLIAKKSGDITIRATSTTDNQIFDEKNVHITNILPEVQDFEMDSWSKISAYLFNGIESLREAYKDTKSYKENGSTFVGLTRQLKLDGVWYNVRVIGEEQDEIYGSGGKKVALTFEFVEPFVIKFDDKIYNLETRGWDKGNKNEGWTYWYNSEKDDPSFLWSFLNDEIEPLITEGMGFSSDESIIKTVVKTTFGHYDAGEEYWKAMQSADKVFLPSFAEIFNFDQVESLRPGRGDLKDIYDYRNDYKQENQRYQWYANNPDDKIKLGILDEEGTCEGFEKCFPGLNPLRVWLRTVSSWRPRCLYSYKKDFSRWNTEAGFAPMFCI